MKQIAIFLAEGFEEIEGLTVVDILRRAGLTIDMVSITGSVKVTGSHGIEITADKTISATDFTKLDMIVLPGGMPGTKNLENCEALMKQVDTFAKEEKYLAAICAAPGLVLSQLDGLEGVEFTCFDGFEAHLQAKGAVFTPKPAVVCGRIITGRSAGHAPAFGLAILDRLRGAEVAAEVRHALYLD